jgi:Zn-dependent protease with chaperone function
MTASLRALRALVLLAGFYVMGIALLAVVLGLDWALLVGPLATGYFPLGLFFFSTMLIIPIVRGMLAFLLAGRRGEGKTGYVVPPDDQPELWAEIGEAARLAGTYPPDRLVLLGDVNAGVSERARLLGLLSGRRTMYVGVPLLAGLTVPRLRSVLAHEFGHYSNQDTRLAGITMRGREAVAHTIEAFRDGGSRAHVVIGNLYVRYANFFLRVTQSVGRRQEFAADATAARSTGRDTTAGALQEVSLLSAAYDYYMDEYALIGRDASVLPLAGQVFGGFPLMLAARGPEGLAALSAGRRPEKPSPYDSHPTTAERVAAIKALPDDGLHDDPAAPAGLSLLRDPDAVLAAVEASTLVDSLVAMPRLDWPELITATAVAEARGAAEPFQKAVSRAVRTQAADGTGAEGGLPGLDGVLDAIDAGLLWMAVADRIPKPAAASRLTGASARNFIRPVVRDGLTGLVHLGLLAEGRARGAMSWATPAHLALPAAYEQGLAPAVEAAIADTPDTSALRALLSGEPVAAR